MTGRRRALTLILDPSSIFDPDTSEWSETLHGTNVTQMSCTNPSLIDFFQMSSMDEAGIFLVNNYAVDHDCEKKVFC
jgi:hypothetical protein